MTDFAKLNIDKSSWVLTRLGDLAEEISKREDNPSSSDFDRFVGLEHFVSGELKIKDWKPTDDLVSAAKVFQSGDILFARRNAYLKRASMVEFDGVCSGDAFVLRENHDKVVPGFLAFIVNSTALWEYANSNAAGTMSKRVIWRDLAEYQFLLPPKDQQAKIAELLWAMDDVVEKEKVVLEKLKISYLSEIEKVLLKKDGEKRKVSDLGKIIRGVGYKPDDLLDEYSDDNCIILRANNIKDSDINYDDIKILKLSKVKNFQLLKQNDFAICMSNGSKELVGKTAKYNDELKNVSIGSFCAAFRANGAKEISIVQHYFASETYRQTIKRVLTGSNINNLKPTDIESIKYRINEFESIVNNSLAKLDQMKNTTVFIKNSIQQSNQLQKSLINEIFSV